MVRHSEAYLNLPRVKAAKLLARPHGAYRARVRGLSPARGLLARLAPAPCAPALPGAVWA